MKRKFMATAGALILFLLCLPSGAVRVSAQQPTPTQQVAPIPVAPTPMPLSDLERRIYQLEVQQTQTIASLQRSNNYNQFLITGVGVFIAILVTIQGFVTFVQVRRERQQD